MRPNSSVNCRVDEFKSNDLSLLQCIHDDYYAKSLQAAIVIFKTS